MKRLGCASLLALILSCHIVRCPLEKQVMTHIESFARNYRRPFTVFELCDSLDNAQLLTMLDHERSLTLVVCALEPHQKLNDRIMSYQNLIVVNPPYTTVAMLNMLARCEQPDLVVVHDVPAYCEPLFKQYMDHILRLGDYCMLDFTTSHADAMQQCMNDKRFVSLVHHDHDTGGMLLFKTHKEGLAKARWTSKMKRKNPERIRYHVQSDFEHKTMIKDIDFHAIESNWERGINLITFVMLYGIYPTDAMIMRQLKMLKSINHNDLVMGNLLIQGRRIVPIDFNDKRRNIRSDICVDALLKVFQLHDLRMQSPERFMNEYKKCIKPKRLRKA